jgi:hypothetical protein
MFTQEQEADPMMLQKETVVILPVFRVFSAEIVFRPELLFILTPG